MMLLVKGRTFPTILPEDVYLLRVSFALQGLGQTQ